MKNEKGKVIETVKNPDHIVHGHGEELLAIKHFSETSIGEKHCVAACRKENDEGFIITAFMTSKGDKLIEERKSWRK